MEHTIMAFHKLTTERELFIQTFLTDNLRNQINNPSN